MMTDAYETHVRSLIQAHLACAVPLAIQQLRAKGGPTEGDFAWVRSHASYLGANGDALFFHTKGKSGQVMDVRVDAVSVLAFCPGGICTYGVSFNESGIPGPPAPDRSTRKEEQR